MSNIDQNYVMKSVDSPSQSSLEDSDMDEEYMNDSPSFIENPCHVDDLQDVAMKVLIGPELKESLYEAHSADHMESNLSHEAEVGLHEMRLLTRKFRRLTLEDKVAKEQSGLVEALKSLYKKTIEAEENTYESASQPFLKEVKELKKIISDVKISELIGQFRAAREKIQGDSRKIACLFYTTSGKFQVRIIERDLAFQDPFFFEALRYTAKKLHEVMGEAIDREAVYELLDLLKENDKAFSSNQLDTIKIIITRLKYLLETQTKSESKNDSRDLIRFFYQLQKLVEYHETYLHSLREMNSWTSDFAESWLWQYSEVSACIEEINQLHDLAKVMCSRLPIVKIGRFAFSTRLQRELKDPVYNDVLSFLSAEDGFKVGYTGLPQRFDFDYFNLISEVYPKDYSEQILFEVFTLTDLDTIPAHLQVKLEAIRHLDMKHLCLIPCIGNSQALIEKFLSFCPNILSFKANLKKDSDVKLFSSALKKMPQIRKLELIGYQVTDKFIHEISSDVALDELILRSTNITGKCLSQEGFISLKKLTLNCCPKVLDKELYNLSSRELIEFNCGYNFITGSCLSSPSYAKLQRLSLEGCKKISDKELYNLSSKNLKYLDCRFTPIEGGFLHERAFKNLKVLILEGCTGINEMNLRTISSTSIEELDCSSTLITGRCLSADAFKNLKKLKLENCEEITDEALQGISSTQLTVLDCGSTSFNGRCLSKDAFKKLKVLNLSNCSGITDDVLSSLAAKNIEELNCRETNITGACFAGDGFKKLKILDVSFCAGLHDDELYKIASTELIDFQCRSTSLTGKCFGGKAFRTVKIIDASRCKNLSDKEVFFLSSRELEEVDFSSTNLTGECFSSKAFKTLKVLNMSDCKVLSDACLKLLSSLALEKVDCSNTFITGSCFSAEAFKTTKKLCLEGCDNLKDDDLKQLSSNSLTDLDLSSSSIIGYCLAADGFKNVKRLDLRDCEHLTDSALMLLSSTALESVCCCCTPITGRCFSAKAFENLKNLCVSGCDHISDVELKSLVAKNLLEFDCSSTPISGSCFSAPAFRNLYAIDVSSCKNLNPLSLHVFDGQPIDIILR